VGNKLLTVRETAEALGLKPATIRAWILRRKLVYVRCGRAIRVPERIIEEFIAANTVPAKAGSR
jgi:excisionase family DNA binding protein